MLSDVFVWYSLVGTAGTALGQLICGWIISSLQSLHGWAFIPSCQIIFFVYAGIGALKFLLTLGLTQKVEATKKEEPQSGETRPLLNESSSNSAEQESNQPPKKKSLWSILDADLWSLVIRLFILFGLDSFASGLASL